MIVSAVVRADGRPISLSALGEILGCDEALDPRNLVAVQICHIRRAFREIDPAFAAVQTVRGTGIRWAA
jgi:DNA-binding response OmpR family regulator